MRHTPSGRRILGLTMASLAAVQWAAQPVILKILVKSLDLYTIGWIRFMAAALLLAPLVIRRQGLAALLRLRGWPLVLLVLCVIGLCGNYLTFMASLRFVSPGAAQVLIQLGPMLVLVGGLLIYGESFSRLQWGGFATLVAGLALFVSPHLGELIDDSGPFGVGLLWLLISAALWAMYMLTQKQLLSYILPESVLFVVFGVGALALLPVAQPTHCAGLGRVQLILLVASCLLTVLSYINYTKALEHVETSRIGVVIALSPLITIVIATLFAAVLPTLMRPEQLTPTSISGAVLVVAGSMLGALGSLDRPGSAPLARGAGS